MFISCEYLIISSLINFIIWAQYSSNYIAIRILWNKPTSKILSKFSGTFCFNNFISRRRLSCSTV
nr:MAG TPA: hypothetical protein [Bacteriophage sp.]